MYTEGPWEKEAALKDKIVAAMAETVDDDDPEEQLSSTKTIAIERCKHLRKYVDGKKSTHIHDLAETIPT